MINAVFERDNYRLTVKGHANSGESGHDLVCAAVSVLTDTLVLNIKRLKKQGVIKKYKTERKNGKTVLSCVSDDSYAAIVSLIFQAFCLGLRQLAKDCPENISFEIISPQGVEREKENSV